MIEFLFKYPPQQLRAGDLELAVPWETFAAIVAVIALAVLWLLGYLRLPRHARRDQPGRRSALAAARTFLFALLAFSLLSPRLVVPVEEPDRVRVAVLIDDSLSMRIEDQDGAARAEYARLMFAPGTGAVSRQLEARFETEFFRFADDAAPLERASDLGFSGNGTDLAGALRRTQVALKDPPLAALIAVSDGGDDGTEALSDTLAGLRGAGIPVHAIGVGSEHFALDFEISDVRMPQAVLAGDTLEAEVSIGHRGADGRDVRLLVEDDGLIVAEKKIALTAGRTRATTRVELALKEPGVHDLVFRIPAETGEMVADNNEHRAAVNVRQDKIHVLHLEGEPRFEVKFTRRAVDDDENIRLVSLVRTSDNKLYRLGVESADELADGFPTTADSLFAFGVVIIGSLEASRLTEAQQRLLVEFVDRRGGGLLLLGGRHAFAEGGYANSPLAGLMPVVLDSRAAAFRSQVRIEPTRNGLRHAVIRGLDQEVWARLPALAMVNPIRRLKPGAMLLLEGRAGGERPLVALASQRYGRGTVAVLPVRDTWRWQMHSQVPLDDHTHETLWRQLIRWLARPAAGRVRLHVTPRQGTAGKPVRVVADVVDPSYRALPDARVRLTVDDPLGDRTVTDLDWQGQVEGRYEIRLPLAQDGRHDLRAELIEQGEAVAADSAHLHVSGSGREYYGAELDTALLRRVAAETGGQYFAASAAADVIDAVAQTGGGRTMIKPLPLWDAPVLYLLMLALVCIEWSLRRRWGWR